MMFDPFRSRRRKQRLQREAQDEMQYLQRRHGASALSAAREKLMRPDLTSWGRSIVAEAIKQLERIQVEVKAEHRKPTRRSLRADFSAIETAPSHQA